MRNPPTTRGAGACCPRPDAFHSEKGPTVNQPSAYAVGGKKRDDSSTPVGTDCFFSTFLKIAPAGCVCTSTCTHR